MQLSISQISKYLECPRKWWFDRVVRLPGDGKGGYARAFGNILHAAAERYLGAGPDGRADGKPVELFPKGWMWDAENGVRLTPEDEATVKDLIHQAIEEGMLQRQPDGSVEEEFFGILYSSPADEFCRGVVAISGKVDYQYGTTIEDHKTTKNPRYMKSDDPTAKEYLGKDPQLLLYALVAGTRLKLPPDGVMTIRHNYYIKQPPALCIKETTVTMTQCRAIWKTLQDHAKAILPLARIKDINRWPQVPGALQGAGEGPSACNKYHTQCPYLGICSRSETASKYRLRMLRLKHPEALADTEDLMANPKDSITAKIAAARAKTAAAAKPAAKAAAKPKAKPAPAPEPEVEAEPEVEETPEEEIVVEDDVPEEAAAVSLNADEVAAAVLTGLRDALIAAFPAS